MNFDPNDVIIRVSGDHIIAHVADDPTDELIVGNAHVGVSVRDILDDVERLLG